MTTHTNDVRGEKMQREIKFRAWDGSTMYEVTQLRLDTGAVSRRASTTTHVRVSDPVRMQYTGLKDANGVEIFEGDIVKLESEILQVLWDEGAFWFGDRYPQVHGYDYHYLKVNNRWNCEVIGNIYENPELLQPPTTSGGTV